MVFTVGEEFISSKGMDGQRLIDKENVEDDDVESVVDEDEDGVEDEEDENRESLETRAGDQGMVRRLSAQEVVKGLRPRKLFGPVGSGGRHEARGHQCC